MKGKIQGAGSKDSSSHVSWRSTQPGVNQSPLLLSNLHVHCINFVHTAFVGSAKMFLAGLSALSFSGLRMIKGVLCLDKK
jgi:hypothetical protein